MAILVVLLLIGIGVSEYLKYDEKQKPYGVTIAIVNDTTRIISWSSSQLEQQPYIEWVRSDEFQKWTSSNVSTTASTIKEYINTNGEIYYLYSVELDNLIEGNSYTYRVGGSISRSRGENSTFTINKANQEEFSFIHVTDSQGDTKDDYQIWGNTLDKALSILPQAQFIVHGGDMTEDPNVEQQWKWFFQYAKPFSAIPLMPTTGNHEQLEKDGHSLVAHFTMPDNGASKLVSGTSYYFDYNNMLYISLNTEADLTMQTEWLEEVLKQNTQPWIIVSMHRGVYGGNRFKEADEWVDLFDKYGVQLVLQGHNHEYSRSYSLIDGDIVESDANDITEGTVYVTLNASGHKLNEKKADKKYQAVHFQNGLQMFGTVTISANELIYNAYDVDGNLLDSFTMRQ